MGTVYRQIAHRLRIQRGPGRPDKVSERPRKDKRGPFLDGNDPTLIEIEEGDRVDVGFLLRTGALEPWNPPEPAEEEVELGQEAQ